MAGSLVEIGVDTRDVTRVLTRFSDRLGDPRPAMEIIGEIITASVQRNFEKGGRPSTWEVLSPVTLALKKGQGSTLIGKGGMASGLMGSIHYEAESDVVYIGTNKIYAATHQFGRPGGGWGGSDIPAREFLVVQEEDWDEIVMAIDEYLFQMTA